MSQVESAVSTAQVDGHPVPFMGEILTPDALAFVADLHRRFETRRRELLAARVEREAAIAGGAMPDFLPETADVRAGDWTVAELPEDILDRRVEITGPVDRKMIINALNSGANVFMADFEDSNAPSWENVIDGQVNLADAVRRQIQHVDPKNGKTYRLVDDPAVLFVRPRGWHLTEKHVKVDGEPVSASLFDFGLFFFHNAQEQLARGTGPYFYLPKLESHLEARLWNDVFVHAQDALAIPQGSIKATVLIETILAAFEMDEILFELREHSAGLNCGRWDYIFSFIKKFREHADCVLPDRATVGMDRHFLSSYSQLLIKTCHRRRVHAMGGMAAQIPRKDDAGKNEEALAKVRADKQREVGNGHDGTWVAHPGLVGLAKDIFDAAMPGPNQFDAGLDVEIGAADLLAVPEGAITEAGLRQNLNVGVLYLEAWLRGVGCVPLYHLMEDAATAEISRAQVWQWVRHGAALDDGRTVDTTLFRQVLEEEVASIRQALGDQPNQLDHAARLFDEMIAKEWSDFLTLPAYDLLAEARPPVRTIVGRWLRPGVCLFESRFFGDARGGFAETFNVERLAEAGVSMRVDQVNQSVSARGVLRGLHFQQAPAAQAKLVRAIVGSVYDAVVDIRAGSPTFGEWYGVQLDESNHYALYVPPGFAHGFCSLKDGSVVSYCVEGGYRPDLEDGLRFDAVDIPWPIAEMTPNARDAGFPGLDGVYRFEG